MINIRFSVVPGDVDNLCAKDAIYFSMHKFVGGVQTPGILVAKKELFKNNIAPYESGGGSVFFVTENDHKYLKETELREEAGTPAIVESIRGNIVISRKKKKYMENFDFTFSPNYSWIGNEIEKISRSSTNNSKRTSTFVKVQRKIIQK